MGKSVLSSVTSCVRRRAGYKFGFRKNVRVAKMAAARWEVMQGIRERDQGKERGCEVEGSGDDRERMNSRMMG